jgi:flagellar basal body-associated protein FliL
MSTPNNPSNSPDYRSAAQWANNYLKNPNPKKDDSINIFWIVVVLLLLALALWWWWTTYKSKTKTLESAPKIQTGTSNGEAPVSGMSPLDEMKKSANKSGRFIVKPNGTVLRE